VGNIRTQIWEGGAQLDKHDVEWRGYWPASPTPFTKEGEFDEASFRKLLELYLDGGMHGILINGSTGEWFSQTRQERASVARIAVEHIRGKVPVVIGCSSFTARESIEIGQHAQSIGADGIMVTPPAYAALQPDEIVNFYRMVSDAVELPLMIYNVPGRVVVSTTPAVVAELAKLPTVVAIKNTVADGEFFETLSVVGDRLRVFGGNFMSELGIAALRHIGGDGFVGLGMLWSGEPDFFNAIWQGDYERASRNAKTEGALGTLMRMPDGRPRFGRSLQSQHKAAQKIIGQPGGYPRLPLLTLDDKSQLEELRSGLDALGIGQAQVGQKLVSRTSG